MFPPLVLGKNMCASFVAPHEISLLARLPALDSSSFNVSRCHG
ncbi:MAG: hypothetical protein QXF23_06250 [Candidatus Bathyarchaeia archaeon]